MALFPQGLRLRRVQPWGWSQVALCLPELQSLVELSHRVSLRHDRLVLPLWHLQQAELFLRESRPRDRLVLRWSKQ